MYSSVTLPHDRAHLLTLNNPKYRQIVKEFFTFQLSQDGEDITTGLILDEAKEISAEIISREQGILSGQEELSFLLQNSNIESIWHFTDGVSFKSGDPLLTLFGDAHEILRLERTLLNFLSRMSGITTHTHQFTSQLPDNIYLAATRKTLWGMLDKKAVALGGGLTHRLGLFDAILLKENHLTLADGIKNIMERVSKVEKTSFWEIELGTEDELSEVLNTLEQLTFKTPGVIMFDNFSPEDISRILQRVRVAEWNERHIFFEASGGITSENFLEFVDTGVNVLSVGFLTKHAQSLDLSMKVKKP